MPRMLHEHPAMLLPSTYICYDKL